MRDRLKILHIFLESFFLMIYSYLFIITTSSIVNSIVQHKVNYIAIFAGIFCVVVFIRGIVQVKYLIDIIKTNN